MAMLDKRLVKEALGVKFFLGLSIGLNLLLSFLIVGQAYALAKLIDAVFLGGSSFAEVRGLVYIIVAIIAGRAVLQLLAEVFAREGAEIVKENLRLRLFEHLMNLGPIPTRGERTGEIANVFVEGVETLEDYIARYIPQLTLAAGIPLVIIAFVFPLDGITGITLLVTAPLIPMFMILIGKLANDKAKQQWRNLGRMSAHLLDVLQGLGTLKVFNRSKAQIEVVRRVSQNFRKTTLSVLRIAFLSALTLELLATISTALIAVSLGLRLVEGLMEFREAFFLLLLAPEVYQPLRNLGIQYHAGMSGSNAANSIFALLETPSPMIPRETSQISQTSQTSHILPVVYLPQSVSGRLFAGTLSITFDNVSFRYDPQTPLIEGISFTLKSGEQVALIGASGAGKSTIVQLLLGFIQPTRGMITVNGIPLCELGRDRWLEQVAYVPQNPYLFPASIYDNILIGRPDAGPDEVMEAARLAGAHPFIAQLPEGYDTMLGEKGVRLSGGQAQRIALARAFLKNAPVLVLDEATTGLDAANEDLVYQALAKLTPEKIVLFISHRSRAVRRADRILELVDGRVIERQASGVAAFAAEVEAGAPGGEEA